MVPVQPAPGTAGGYLRAPRRTSAPYVKNLLVLRGYRLTTGYAGFFPAVRHPLGGARSLQLSGIAMVVHAGGLPAGRAAAASPACDCSTMAARDAPARCS